MHRSLVVAAVFFAAAAIAPAAQARETRISYADLNLSSQAGAQAFEARVRHAARRVCGDGVGRVSLREATQIHACKRDFIDRAMTRVASLSPAPRA